MFWLAFRLHVSIYPFPADFVRSSSFSRSASAAISTGGWFNRSVDIVSRHFFLPLISSLSLYRIPGLVDFLEKQGGHSRIVCVTCASVMAWLRAHPLINLRKIGVANSIPLFEANKQTTKRQEQTTRRVLGARMIIIIKKRPKWLGRGFRHFPVTFFFASYL